MFERSMPSGSIQAWMPVRVKARLAARGRHAATGDAVRELTPAVEWQIEVNPHPHPTFSVVLQNRVLLPALTTLI
jgi:hypothetical protein